MRRPIVLAWVAFGLILLVAHFYVAAFMQYILPQEDPGDALLLILVFPSIWAVAACAPPAWVLRRMSRLEPSRRSPLHWMAAIAVTTLYLNWLARQ